MIRVETASRLHFGLFNFAAEEMWANVDGAASLPARRFGGVGLMIEAPALAVVAEPARSWSAIGPLAVRALEFGRRFEASLPKGMPPQRLTVEQAPPEHVGLGAGTQLGLAVAKALALSIGHADWDTVELARRVSRGLRSAVGIHAFQHGGFIVEGGKRGERDLGPLLVRTEFPRDWRIVLAVPMQDTGLHGTSERQAFARLRESAPATTLDGLCRLVLLGLLPALAECDYPNFSEALYDFNARVGEAFAGAQGGRYATPFATEAVAFLRGLGVTGVGQSSWGPATFALLEDEDHAQNVVEQMKHHFPDDAIQIILTSARPSGARH